MLLKISSHEYVLTDGVGLPRYWAAAWTLLVGCSLAASTLKRHLANIESFYVSADTDRKSGALDDALGSLDLPMLEELLEAFFVTLTNVPVVGETAERRWHDALGFVRDVCERLSRAPAVSVRFEDVRLRLERLNRLYGHLRAIKRSRPPMVRALPAAVLQELISMVIPGAVNNPFQADASQWRVFAVFLLLLHQGLRRGEVLSLPADFLKSERTGNGIQYWLNVRNNEYENDDPRHSVPSIKTISSIRQIPVSSSTAGALMTYLENYRGKQIHSFFLSSAKDQPLSAEGLQYFFRQLTNALPLEQRKVLYERTGMNSVSAHDLRHTAAVVRLKQLLSRGDPMPEALQKLRSFFGWSPGSPMPQLYAKAAFEERLQTVWNDEFDDRVAMLMALPQ